MFKFLDYLASFDAADGHAFLLHLPPIRRAKLLYLPAPDVLLGQVPECIGGVNFVEDVRVIRGFTTPSPARTSENVTASISWSIAPVLSFQEASRTAMYAGTFVLLLLPAVAYWGSLVVACAGHDRRFVGVGSCSRVGRRWEAPGDGRRWCVPYVRGIGRSGGRWRWKPVLTAALAFGAVSTYTYTLALVEGENIGERL